MILDTSALLAALDPDQVDHERCAAVLRDARRPVLSPFVLAETDYFVRRVRTVADEVALLEQVGSGALPLALFDSDDVALASSIISHYEDLDLGLADASIVVLAHRHRTTEVFTLDERHFRALVGLDGKPFRILPADAA